MPESVFGGGTASFTEPQPAARLLAQLKAAFGDGCVDFGAEAEERAEQIALCGESALSEYLERGEVSDDTVTALIYRGGKQASVSLTLAEAKG